MSEIKNETSNFSYEESLKTIESMIDVAKGKVNDNSFYFILWGWVIFVGALGNYILAALNFTNPSKAWLVVFVGVALSIIYGSRQVKSSHTTTHLDYIYNGIWIIFGVNYIILFIWAIYSNQMQVVNIFISLIAGMCTFLSGVTLRFKPLMVGGLLLCLTGALSIFFPQYQLLLLALGIFVGYLIPGYMLKRTS